MGEVTTDLRTRYQKLDRIHSNADTKVEVFTVLEVSTGKKAIWKEQTCHSNEEFQLFQKTSETQSRLAHKYVNKVLEFEYSKDQDGYHSVLITERADSDLLKEIEKRKKINQPWTEEELGSILGMSANALNDFQASGICHRDVKPANIFINKDGCIKIGDFGYVREIDRVEGEFSFKGSRFYWSPKLRQGIMTGKAVHNPYLSDIFSLGISLFHMASLDLPIDSSPESLRRQIQALNYSRGFKEVLTVMLAEDEQNRIDFQTLATTVPDTGPLRSNFLEPGRPSICAKCKSVDAEFICACKFPVWELCAECLDVHRRIDSQVSHSTFSHSASKFIKSRKDVKAIRKRIEIRDNWIVIGLETTVETAQSAIETIYDSSMGNLTQNQAEEISRLQEGIDRIKALNSNLIDKFESDLPKFPYSVFTTCKTLSKCLFEDGYIQSNSALFKLLTVEYSFEGIFLPIALPAFIGNKMKVYEPGVIEPLKVQDISTVSINENTAFAYVNNTTVCGCGGDMDKNQLFLINFYNGQVTPLLRTIFPRSAAGIIYMVGAIFIFGGLGESRNAEVFYMEYNSVQELGQMQVARAKFNPCEYQGKIYLSGSVVEAFNPQDGQYQQIWLFPEDIKESYTFVVKNSLYVFNKKGLYELGQPARQHKSRWCKSGYRSNQVTKCIGNKVHLFNPVSQKFQVLDIKKLNPPVDYTGHHFHFS